MDSVGTFKEKEKSPPSRNRSSIGRLPKAAEADHESKNCPPRTNVKKHALPRKPEE
jgi:hypothetical protein